MMNPAEKRVPTRTEQMPETLRLSLILGLIAFCVSLMLALVNGLTAPIITQNAVTQRNEALRSIFADADAFDPVDIPPVDPVTGGYRVRKGDGTIGLILQTNTRGYAGEIEMVVGFDMEGRVVGLQYLSLSETVGIGSRVQEAFFWGQFIGKNEFSTVDAISKATISSTAVKSSVEAAAEQARTWVSAHQ